MGDNLSLTGGTFYINGEEIGRGIPDFECSADDLKTELENNIKYNLDPPGEFSVTLKMHIDEIFTAKMMGIYQWVCDYCPNRRVIHLMKYGKNKRVKIKNLKRAFILTCVYFIKQEI